MGREGGAGGENKSQRILIDLVNPHRRRCIDQFTVEYDLILFLTTLSETEAAVAHYWVKNGASVTERH